MPQETNTVLQVKVTLWKNPRKPRKNTRFSQFINEPYPTKKHGNERFVCPRFHFPNSQLLIVSLLSQEVKLCPPERGFLILIGRLLGRFRACCPSQENSKR